VRQWAEEDPRVARDWALQVEDSPLRMELLRDVSVIFAATSPWEAAALAVDVLPAGRPQEDAVIGIVQTWTQTDAPQAAAWVSEFPEGVLAESAVQELVKVWTQGDRVAAARWLDSLPAGILRDTGVETYIRLIATGEPQAALAWADTISESTRRQRCTEILSIDRGEP
jgi:hypothetical protein